MNNYLHAIAHIVMTLMIAVMALPALSALEFKFYPCEEVVEALHAVGSDFQHIDTAKQGSIWYSTGTFHQKRHCSAKFIQITSYTTKNGRVNKLSEHVGSVPTVPRLNADLITHLHRVPCDAVPGTVLRYKVTVIWDSWPMLPFTEVRHKYTPVELLVLPREEDKPCPQPHDASNDSSL